MIFIQYLIDATAIGSLYALVALGFGLIFGVLRIVNFAHGELLMIGGYTLYATRNWPMVLSIVTLLVVVAGVSVLMERLIFRPVRGATPATMLVLTFGVSFLLRSIALRQWSAQGKTVMAFSGLNKSFLVGDLRIRYVTILAILTCGLLLFLVTLFLTRTDTGLQMRAASTDFAMARALGVRADSITVAAFIIAGFLAAVATLFFVVQRPVITPSFGLQIGIIALVGVVVGGLERLVPATIGGFFIGFANAMLGSVLPSAQRIFLDSALYGLVILVLLFKPQGMFQRSFTAERL
jgi:branched-chain amino acid transport system permease protein